MGKNKLQRFAENTTFGNLFQPSFTEVFHNDFYLKGQWQKKYFGNQHPITIELGCGKGEYTLALAAKYPEKNFIGIDIKGARLWYGAKAAHNNKSTNIAFIRSRIEFIRSFFSKDEVEEIWITFPDSQLKKRRIKKRLTSSGFLRSYQTFFKDNGIIHLKTDNDILYRYTYAIAKKNALPILQASNNIYSENIHDEILYTKTFYEKQHLAKGLTIKYIAFRLPFKVIVEEPDEEIYANKQ